jgi:hypothetical protein
MVFDFLSSYDVNDNARRMNQAESSKKLAIEVDEEIKIDFPKL